MRPTYHSIPTATHNTRDRKHKAKKQNPGKRLRDQAVAGTCKFRISINFFFSILTSAEMKARNEQEKPVPGFHQPHTHAPKPETGAAPQPESLFWRLTPDIPQSAHLHSGRCAPQTGSSWSCQRWSPLTRRGRTPMCHSGPTQDHVTEHRYCFRHSGFNDKCLSSPPVILGLTVIGPGDDLTQFWTFS